MNPHRKHLSVLEYLNRVYAKTPRLLSFNATNLNQWKSWRRKLRKKVLELVGGFPKTRCPLKPRLDYTKQKKTHTLEKAYIYTEPDVAVPLYVLKPRNVKPPYKAIIALHGHGSGARGIVGQEKTKEERQSIKQHGSDYGLRLVNMGYMVFAPDLRGFGEMRDEPELSGNPCEWSCGKQSLNAFLFGKTLIGMRVWDVSRIIDYIKSRPEKIANKKIPCIGQSGGGTVSLYAGALLDEVSPVVISGYFNMFKNSIMDLIHCECNYVPGILKYAELPDIVALVAPKPLFLEGARFDEIFPVKGFRRALRTVKAAYELVGATGNLAYDITDNQHKFDGRKSLKWIESHLE